MSSDYWILNAEATGPVCGSQGMRELQTHWLGEVGSCLNVYRIGEPILELESALAATMDGLGDRIFIGRCVDYRASLDYGGRIDNEAVTEIWPVGPRVLSAERSTRIASAVFGKA